MKRNGAYFLSVLCAFCGGFPINAAERPVPLTTELKFSGPSVSIQAPLGFRYRPGCAFPLTVLIRNSGSEINAEIFVSEGSGIRYALPTSVALPAGSSQQHTLMVRAPAVTANLTLVVRSIQPNSSVRPEIFRASLNKIFKPLAPHARIILGCGSIAAPHGPNDQAMQIPAREFPDELWRYESVDWVVLSDGSLRDASAKAKTALRQWVLAGGRLFIGSNDALAVAVRENLLPLDPQVGSVKSEVAWWEAHAGMTKDDVLAQKNFRPVFVRLRLGFGQAVLLFPGASSEDAAAFGAGVFQRSDLQPVRESAADLRVQPDRFNAFVSGGVSERRRSDASKSLGLGALILCCVIAFSFSARSKIEAASLPIGFGALLLMLLANWFPEFDLIASRVAWTRISTDGRVSQRTEWQLVETFHNSKMLQCATQPGGSLVELAFDTEDLAQQRYETSVRDGAPNIRDVPVSQSEPVMFSASQAGSIDASALSFRSNDGKIQIENVRCPRASENAILVQRDRKIALLRVESKSGFQVLPYSSAAVRNCLRGPENLVNARAAALAWVTKDALSRGEDTLILFDEQNAPASLIRFENGAPEEALHFEICSTAVTLKQ